MKNSMSYLVAAVACLAMFNLTAFAGNGGPAPTPEPSTVLLVAGAGGALLVIRHWRKKK